MYLQEKTLTRYYKSEEKHIYIMYIIFLEKEDKYSSYI